MDTLLGFVVGAFVLATVIVTWLNRGAIQQLQDEQQRLRAQLRRLTEQLAQTPADPPAAPAASAPQAPPVPPAPAVQAGADDDWPDAVPAARPAEPATAPVRERLSFEQQFGARLPTWIGALALILAGFFLVKYSIEMGWVTPGVRVVLGLLFGGALLGAAAAVRHHKLAGGKRIAQALAGAGIADCYICIFAACTLYDLVPAWLAFIGMAGVTAGAVFLALEHGLPIALLGLLGGFLTPALIHTGAPSAPLLFSYLYLLFAGFIFIIRQRHWWLLAVPALLGSFLWVALWLFGGYYGPDDTLWLGLFLLAVSATAVAAQHRQLVDEPLLQVGKAGLALHYGALGGAVLFMSLLAGQGGFNDLEWGLFALLSLGGIALAFFEQRLYGFVPWLTLAANALLLLVWRVESAAHYAAVLTLFAALHGVSGYLLQARAAQPLLWSGLVTASGFGYFLIAYGKLRYTPELQAIPLFWGLLALALAAGAVELLRRLTRQIPPGHAQRESVLSLYAATATAFVALALTIILEREFLSVALALEMLALCWLGGKFTLPALRRLAAVLAIAFGVLLVPQILLLIQLTAFSLVEAKLMLQETVPLVEWPLFQLGLPALCFIGGSLLLRQRQDDRITQGFELAAVALIGVMGYYLSRHAFHPHDNILFVTAGFGERGAITTVLFLYGLACTALGQRFARGHVRTGGLVLVGIGLFRIVWFDGLRYNPLWAEQDVGAWPLLNRLWLPYLLPVGWLAALLRLNPPQLTAPSRRLVVKAVMLGLLFFGVTLQVRQLYHGAFLQQGETGNAEIYTYSVVWLLLGIVLLAVGTLQQARLLRVASLLLMLLTVGKVFLFDAAALQGLYRVFSFFGLGLSLLALSWFYARFVFVKTETAAPAGEDI